jgi:hypothetical protein
VPAPVSLVQAGGSLAGKAMPKVEAAVLYPPASWPRTKNSGTQLLISSGHF